MSLFSKLPRLLTVLLGLFLLSLAGCAMSGEGKLQNALIKPVDVSQKQTIENKISTWFGGLSITISDDAFSQTSSITIERKVKVDSRGLPIEGRHDKPVYSFTLLSDGKRCLLRNDQTDELAELDDIECNINPESADK